MKVQVSIVILILSILVSSSPAFAAKAVIDDVKLPAAVTSGRLSVEEALLKRRSIRGYKDDALLLKDLGQLLWAAQGTSSKGGKRTAPSAGSTYPLELYVVVGAVEGLTPGIYRYDPDKHDLDVVVSGDVRAALAKASLGQPWVANAPATIAFAAVMERTTERYGKRGVQYVHNEVGHAAQNIYLQAVSRGLGTVAVGAFDDDEVKDILRLADEETPCYLMPVGKLRK